MREVITLQIGTNANFSGTHFWNFQDEAMGRELNSNESPQWSEIDSCILYRAGETAQGRETYTPRLLLFDVRESFGSMRANGTLYESATPDLSTVATWTGAKSVYQEDPVPKNDFLQILDEEEQEYKPEVPRKENFQPRSLRTATTDQQLASSLDESVTSWTDYLKLQYHPRSVLQLSPEWTEPHLKSYGEGVALTESGQVLLEDASEGIRFFAEEADHLQGFQCVVDHSGVFSALGSAIVEGLEDEYPHLMRWVTAVSPPEAQKKTPLNVSKELGRILSLIRLASKADLLVPLGRPSLHNAGFPLLQIDDKKPYHWSAVYAAAMDTMTLPFRYKVNGAMSASYSPQGGCDMSSLIHTVSRQQHSRIALCHFSFPAANVQETESGMQFQSSMSDLRNLTLESDEALRVDFKSAEAYVIRGALKSGAVEPLSATQSLQCLQNSIIREANGQCVRHLSAGQQSLAVPLPFPLIFSPTGQGTIPLKGGADISACSAMTRLRSGPCTLPYLQPMLSRLRTEVNRRGGSDLMCRWGIPLEEQREILESLKSMVDTGSENSSDNVF